MDVKLRAKEADLHSKKLAFAAYAARAVAWAEKFAFRTAEPVILVWRDPNVPKRERPIIQTVQSALPLHPLKHHHGVDDI